MIWWTVIGTLASVIGLGVGIYVIYVARGAREAAQAARALARKRNLVEEFRERIPQDSTGREFHPAGTMDSRQVAGRGNSYLLQTNSDQMARPTLRRTKKRSFDCEQPDALHYSGDSGLCGWCDFAEEEDFRRPYSRVGAHQQRAWCGPQGRRKGRGGERWQLTRIELL